ncbi:hypothetical protein ACOSQ4_031366 [Xanthoceras sorbifolium]
MNGEILEQNATGMPGIASKEKLDSGVGNKKRRGTPSKEKKAKKKGDKWKYSHDTVPLTKSKPCCHFTRNSCMKGDDCPFDHQLSKYPCNNFVTNGFCNRGNNCMFSHKKLRWQHAW